MRTERRERAVFLFSPPSPQEKREEAGTGKERENIEGEKETEAAGRRSALFSLSSTLGCSDGGGRSPSGQRLCVRDSVGGRRDGQLCAGSLCYCRA